MDYEKAYKEALERARAGKPMNEVFPELHESEDERIRKRLITLIRILDSQFFTGDNPSKEQCLAYLEKQKDILGERAQNITANMLEDGIEGVQRELIEFLSNTVNASWVDIIQSADAYAERIRNYLEKQKEQKPELYDMGRWDEESYNNGIHHILQNPEIYGLTKQKPTEGDNETEIQKAFREGKSAGRKEVFDHPEEYGLQKAQKPAEWSEEDEMNLYNIIEAIKYTFDVSEGSSGSHLITWLKFHLRPQPHWKPSEEQMEVLKNVAFGSYQNGDGPILRKLYNDLKKIM